MNFTITARVVSQLGIELISSDEVAIYELVKNGFDAGSKIVEVNVNYRLDVSVIRRIQQLALASLPDGSLDDPLSEQAKTQAVGELLRTCGPDHQGEISVLSRAQLKELREKLEGASSVREFLNVLGAVNSIDVVDYGHGMTADEVNLYYLTIGTTHRLQQLRQIVASDQDVPIPSGEKGIGRLSAMRLGYELQMFTIPEAGDESVFVGVHWRDFETLIDRDLADIPVNVNVAEKAGAAPGTVITISDLHSSWSRHRTIRLATEHLAKFLDPFPPLDFPPVAPESPEPTSPRNPKPARTLLLRWNGELIDVTAALKHYLDNCSNSLRCELRVPDGGPAQLVSEFYFSPSGTHPEARSTRTFTVVDFADLTEESFRLIGPIEFALYHFPRNKLKAIPQWASRSEFKSWLDNWCGGLMVFRDRVRVLPYATPGDDWLDLDSRALRGQGFRVNRIQVVGFVRISRIRNPGLIDQTNREGFRDNDAFRAFKELIQRHVHRNFVPDLNAHLSKASPDWGYVSLRVQEQQDDLARIVETIISAVERSDWPAVRNSARDLTQSTEQLRELSAVIETTLAEKEASKVEILELAATGMAAESMAHDLEGAVESAVATLGELGRQSQDKAIVASINHLRAVHKSLLTQIKQIAPGPARSRRRASTFDLVEVVTEAAQLYRERCQRDGIVLHLPDKSQPMTVQVVNGHVRQIIDNLFRNAIFWLLDTKKKFPDHEEFSIRIQTDATARQLRFSDSGIGIAREDTEWIFKPFTSRRSDGRGLGLYICKELADFNGIAMRVDEHDANRWNRLKSFVLEFPEK